nr:MAG TPA: Large Terminase [Caudoviricetes sp.]
MLQRAIEYANSSIGNKEVPKYVQLQCKEFLKIVNGETNYHINNDVLLKMERLFKIIIMPTGKNTGKPVFDSLVGFQCLFFVAVWCTYHNEDLTKRRYENVILELARKNGKTFLIALLFILALLTEVKFSRLFSCAPDGSLSREVYQLIQQFISMSSKIQKWKKKDLFKITRDKLTCNATHNEYVPLNYSTSRMDGRMPSVWLCDETSALPSSYPLSALRLGSLPVKNKLGIMISTKYDRIDTPFEDELIYFRNVLDGIVEDDSAFSLIYEPDEELKKQWETNDLVLKQASPLSVEIPSILDEIIKMREQAIQIPSQRSQFLCKMCNIISADTDNESYIDIQDLKECRIDDFDWNGRSVYLGIDLAMTTDNCAVSMVTRDEYGHLVSRPMCFIPKDRVDVKSKEEKCDYKRYIDDGLCIACGNDVVNYGVIEKYIIDLESTLGVSVEAVGFDRYNALSTVNKLEENDLQCVEVKQHSSVLGAPTKLLYEEICKHNFRYETNELYEINFQNCRCTYDTNMTKFVNKKKSRAKIDMVISTIIAVTLLQQQELFDDTWICC